MKEKGFTLIELLAVIVVLAIIALIAVPMVLDTIEKSRKGAASSSTYSYVSEVETKLATYMLSHSGASYSSGKYSVERLQSDLNIELKGTTPTEGNVCIGSTGLVTEASIKIGGYVVSYDGKTAVTTGLTDIEDIDCNGVPIVTTPEVTVYANGTAIYYNPETGTICDASEAVSTTGTKTGCMKWYTFNDSDSSSTVNMILDHNTTATVVWNSSGSNSEMKEVAEALASDTSTWVSGLNPRLITADEVAQITGNTIFNQETLTYEEWFYLDSNSQTQTAIGQGTSNYAWLYDYLGDCTFYGCNIADESTYGYWTSTPIAGYNDIVWSVDRNGRLASNIIDYVNFGVRPVITIDKSIINV